MIKALVAGLVWMSAMFSSTSHADYSLGCDDPDYHQYVKEQFAYFEARNRRLFDNTLRDYELTLATSNNPYQVIADLSKHLKYSAQFDPIDKVNEKIDRIFDHAQALSAEQRIAGYAYDKFSSETHSVGIARAWIAYRQGKHEAAFDELLKSIEVSGSAVLSSFGPDFTLIRHMYRDGHLAPVVAYINKTEEFWTGKRPDDLRNAWRQMIEAQCKIQFDSVDTIKALELGFSLIDINKKYGLSR